jgi:hypothetical protein
MLTLKPYSNERYTAITKQKNAHPDAALPVAKDFNAGKLKSC